MGIQIVNQTNEQECGVCALTSLHNYHYKNQQIEKDKVLDQSHISKNGMTIFDLEITANKLGLECESYEVKWSEFLDLKINSYFILLVSTINNQTNHYVVAKKHKKYVEIYDSCSSHLDKLKYDDLKKVYLNVLILVTKKPNKIFNNIFAKPKTLLMFDAKFVILNILLSLFLLLTSILCSSLLNWVIDKAVNNNSVRNLLTICFIFVCIFFSNNLITYIQQLYSSSHLKTYYLLFTNKILYSIENKKFSFLNKVDKNWIFKIDECVFTLSNYCVIEINKFITNIIFSAICICIIGIIQYWLLIFVVLIPLIQFIFFIISYRKKKEVFINVIRAENKNTNNYKDLISSINIELWRNKKTHLLDQIKSNYTSLYKNFNDVNLFKGNVNLFKSFLKSLFEIALVLTLAYFIIKDLKITIGSLTFVIATFGLYASSTNDIFGYFLTKQEFDIYWQIYKDITEVDNLKDENFVLTDDKVQTITFANESSKVVFQTSKYNFLSCSVIELFSQTKQLFIDKQKVDLENKQVLDKLIVCDENSSLNINYFLEQFQQNPQPYVKFIKYFNVDLNSQTQSFINKTVLNLLSLFNESNKIIFIDTVLDLFPKKDQIIVKDIINKIQKQNYVFIVRKDEND